MAKKFKVEVTPKGQASEQVLYSNPFKENSQEDLEKYMEEAHKLLNMKDLDFIYFNGLRVTPDDYSNIKVSIVDENNKYVSV